MHHLHPFLRKFSWRSPGPDPHPHPSSEEIFPHAPTPPHRSKIGIQPSPEVDLQVASGSVTDNAMYIFNAILLKIQLSLSEFKRLYLHSRLHHFTSIIFFFKIFSGEAPRTPTNGRGVGRGHPSHTLHTPSGLENPPPRLSSGSATGCGSYCGAPMSKEEFPQQETHRSTFSFTLQIPTCRRKLQWWVSVFYGI